METEDTYGPRCLVTGASGYLGRALVDSLAESGASVIAVSRSSPPALYPNNPKHRSVDLASPDLDLIVELGLKGVDQVFHLAGVAHQQASSDDYATLNVDATARLAQASLVAGVRRFVFVSSVKAAFYEDENLSTVEPGPRAKLTYGLSKALAERRLLDIFEGSDTELVLLRPALVYSADAPGHLALLRRWAASRMPAPPPGGGRSMIARADLVRMCGEISRHHCLGSVLTITATDGESYSARRIHSALCAAMQRQPLLPSPPIWSWRMAARAFDLARGESGTATWSRLVGTEISQSSGYEVLGFEPRYTFERSLEQGL